MRKSGLILSGVLFLSALAEAQTRCDSLITTSAAIKFQEILSQNSASLMKKSDISAMVERAYGTDVPIVHSFEAEGSDVSNIRRWFSETKPSFKTNLQKAFDKQDAFFMKWLATVKLKSHRMTDEMVDWGAMTLKERLDYLLSLDNPMKVMTSKQADELFEGRVVTYDDIKTNEKAPDGITVGDDGGSWEVRSSMGQINRGEFFKLRTQVEDFLDQKIGHQHLFHAWPQDGLVRQQMAPYYLELLDSSTWYLFWRQMKRSDTDVTSRTVVDHPYLGVYSTNSLNRLQDIIENNESGKFHDKYRLVGARNFRASSTIPEQQGDVPDWEIRSGNKGMMREFVEAILESRLVTGDYSGLKAFGSYEFNTNASLYELTRSFMTRGEVETLEKFQDAFPMMKWSTASNAKNNYRTKIISPLLPWEKRFNLDYKADLVQKAQEKYARSLLRIAQDYLRVVNKDETTAQEKLEQRKKALTSIKRALRTFANTARLDLDGELYLKPRLEDGAIPKIQVATGSLIDVNKVDLGIEYSVRLPKNMDFQSLDEAKAGILKLAQKFAAKNGGSTPKPMNTEGHGHGIAAKYTVEDLNKQEWRFEWDGIQRQYDDEGKVVRAYNGHIEIVTPKFSPQEIQGPILDLYKEARSMGLLPRRNAGGAHINFDLAPLKALPVEQGTRALLNLVSYFESNQEVILFMWQHPKRLHAAYPVARTPEMAQAFKNFKGDWNDLGRMLYDVRYFNKYVHRKPKYVPLNLTALMTPIVPQEYLDKTLDIKNAKMKWYPNFNKVYSRGEVRLFDAPTDEVMAALHVKYFRAVMNKAFNSLTPIELKPIYDASRTKAWRKNPKAWLKAAEAHLLDLGLDPNEFRTLIWESYMVQSQNEPRKVDYEIYKDYLPAKGN